ncbi:MAG: hypothetical protein ACD_15C00114G0004 [uncultured bacterium]|nr:MAG: hypothetical protein ACD_15C00114G0004 [uncultured bacterium]
MKKNNKVVAAGAFSFLLLPFKSALAVCPVCTMAVGAGVGFSRWLGIDDTISGVWIGGLTVSMIMWTINWLAKKNIRFEGRDVVVIAAYYLLIVAPLYWMDIMGHPFNTLWGIDKILIGTIIGSALFFLSSFWYEILKKKNGGHSYFPFQKVAMPVLALVLSSTIFYFLTR